MIAIEIVSGEGTGEGTIEAYEGACNPMAIVSRLRKERVGGDRWAYVRIDGERVADASIGDVLRNLADDAPSGLTSDERAELAGLMKRLYWSESESNRVVELKSRMNVGAP